MTILLKRTRDVVRKPQVRSGLVHSIRPEVQLKGPHVVLLIQLMAGHWHGIATATPTAVAALVTMRIAVAVCDAPVGRFREGRDGCEQAFQSL